MASDRPRTREELVAELLDMVYAQLSQERGHDTYSGVDVQARMALLLPAFELGRCAQPAAPAPSQADEERARRIHATWSASSSTAKLVTMSPEAWARLDEIARRTGRTRSATVEALVRAATMPRDLG